RLTYANCGHPAPMLMRASGELERLTSTCTVIGLFPQWTCAIEECALDPGDTLILFSDGVPEAFNDAGEEFGEERLGAVVMEFAQSSPQALAQSVLDSVSEFSGREQSDDITLVVAKRRSV